MIFTINDQLSLPIVRFIDSMYQEAGTVVMINRHIMVVIEESVAQGIEMEVIENLMKSNEFSLTLYRDGREIWFSNDFNSFDNYSYNIENEGGEEHNDKRTLIFSVKKI